MDTNYNKGSNDQIHSDESSVSLDTCETTPLSPRVSCIESEDRSDTAEGKVHFVYEMGQRSKMAPDDPASKLKDGSRQWKLSIIFAFTVFTTVLLIAVSYALKSMRCEEDKERLILHTYKGFFMTKGELGEMMKKMDKQEDMEQYATVRETPDFPDYNCTLSGSHERYSKESRVGASISSDRPVFHGCCETTFSARTYDRLPDQNGRVLKVVQFMDRFQFFFVDSCIHKMHCSLPCTCMQRPRHVTALVAEEDLSNVRLASVVYLGTCKCINHVMN